jgi:XTP/dITP diphosphohydrolase
MKVLFATHNKAKLKLYKEGLESYDIQVISLDDLNIDIEINETGSKPSENAYLKAKGYAEISKMITISVDDGLIFYNYPTDRQPGVNVRRINGKSRTDDELIQHYINEVNIYGVDGKLNGKWIKSLAIAIDEENIITHDFSVDKIFVNVAADKRNPGYPLDSISLDPNLNKYTVNLTDDESKKIQDVSYGGVFEFVLKSIKNKE